MFPSTGSQQSIVSAIDRFMKSTNKVKSIILVPSKLRDIETACIKHSDRQVPALFAHSDLFTVYLMLDQVKKDLLWPDTSNMSDFSMATSSSSSRQPSPVTNTSWSNRQQSQQQQESLQSMSSDESGVSSLTSSSASSSYGSSNGCSDMESDADSLLMSDQMSEGNHEYHHHHHNHHQRSGSSHVTIEFRHHIQGLQAILHQLTDAADYLCLRYQEDMDSLEQLAV